MLRRTRSPSDFTLTPSDVLPQGRRAWRAGPQKMWAAWPLVALAMPAAARETTDEREPRCRDMRHSDTDYDVPEGRAKETSRLHCFPSIRIHAPYRSRSLADAISYQNSCPCQKGICVRSVGKRNTKCVKRTLSDGSICVSFSPFARRPARAVR